MKVQKFINNINIYIYSFFCHVNRFLLLNCCCCLSSEFRWINIYCLIEKSYNMRLKVYFIECVESVLSRLNFGSFFIGWVWIKVVNVPTCFRNSVNEITWNKNSHSNFIEEFLIMDNSHYCLFVFVVISFISFEHFS